MQGETLTVQYAQLSPIHVSDFTPSRVTRRSSNHFLQEHNAIDELYSTVRSPSQLSCVLVQAVEGERKLRGEYIEVDFTNGYPSCSNQTKFMRSSSCEEKGNKVVDIVTREKSVSDPTANGTMQPLCMRRRTERRRTAFRNKSRSSSERSSRSSYEAAFSDATKEMDVEPSVVMYHDRLQDSSSVMSRNNVQAASTTNQHFPQSHTEIRADAPLQEYEYRRGRDAGHNQLQEWFFEDAEKEYRDLSQELPELPETRPVVQPSGHPSGRKPILESTHQSSFFSRSSPAIRTPAPSSLKDRSNSQVEGDRRDNSGRTVFNDASSSTPDLSRRPRSVSFMNCSAGTEQGRFPADYMGSCEMDSYIECVDTVAKNLINLRPVEVMAYVTSEKLRLAPPKNSSLLFKSFAIKDILSIQKCTKNKRIVGIIVWKSKATPLCHVLRCPTQLVSNALYESILEQTQRVDDIAMNKVN